MRRFTVRNRSLAVFATSLSMLIGLSCEPTSGPVSEGSVTLSWERPASNADASPLVDLAGYRLHFGTASPLTTEDATMIVLGDVTTYTVTDLTPGAYYFAVTAVDVNGNVSGFSQEVRVEVGP